jgi:hypothetical protein
MVPVPPAPSGTRLAAGNRRWRRRRGRWRRRDRWRRGRWRRLRSRRRRRIRTGRRRRQLRPGLAAALWRLHPHGVRRTAHASTPGRPRRRGAHSHADEPSRGTRASLGFRRPAGDGICLTSRSRRVLGPRGAKEIERVERHLRRLDPQTGCSRSRLCRSPAGLHSGPPEIAGAHRRSNERGQPQGGRGQHRGKCDLGVRRHGYLIARRGLRPGSSRAPSLGRGRCRPRGAGRPPTDLPRAPRRRSSRSPSPPPCQ